MKKVIELGDKVKDKVSGFTGIAISVHDFLYGCRRISVQKTSTKDAKFEDAQVFDEPQLKIMKKNAFKIEVDEDEPTGGPRAVPRAKSIGRKRTTGRK